MLNFELARDSAKPGDIVYVIVKKRWFGMVGQLLDNPGTKKDDFEIVEAEIEQIHCGYGILSKTIHWSCSLSAVTDDPMCRRYIEDVRMEDCFTEKAEAEVELVRRFS